MKKTIKTIFKRLSTTKKGYEACEKYSSNRNQMGISVALYVHIIHNVRIKTSVCTFFVYFESELFLPYPVIDIAYVLLL